eukprot:358811-Chlamydomonas_euryale.AAC.19
MGPGGWSNGPSAKFGWSQWLQIMCKNNRDLGGDGDSGQGGGCSVGWVYPMLASLQTPSVQQLERHQPRWTLQPCAVGQESRREA